MEDDAVFLGRAVEVRLKRFASGAYHIECSDTFSSREREQIERTIYAYTWNHAGNQLTIMRGERGYTFTSNNLPPDAVPQVQTLLRWLRPVFDGAYTTLASR